MGWNGSGAGVGGPAAVRTVVAMAVAAVMVSGCVSMGPSGGGGFVSDPRLRAVEGTWGDTGGVATASLINGRFVNVANDTGNRVAEGSYAYTGQDPLTGRDTISLDFFSLVRETRVRANCILDTPTTLNCTNDAGQQFQLIRQSRVS